MSTPRPVSCAGGPICCRRRLNRSHRRSDDQRLLCQDRPLSKASLGRSNRMNRALDRKPAVNPVFRRRRASTARTSRRDPRSLDASLAARPCLARVMKSQALPHPSIRPRGREEGSPTAISIKGESTGPVGNASENMTPAPRARRVTRGPRLVAQIAQSAALGSGELGRGASFRLTVLPLRGVVMRSRQLFDVMRNWHGRRAPRQDTRQ
jgi:hypothetical protein